MKKIIFALMAVCVCYCGDLRATLEKASAESVQAANEQTKKEMVIIVQGQEATRIK